MINTLKDLKECLYEESNIYCPRQTHVEQIIVSENNYKIYQYIKWLRRTEYFHNKNTNLFKMFYLFCRRRKNILGRRLGIEIWDCSCDKGLTIYHSGNIVINGMAKIGKNLKLHGSNCIGNKGISLDAPVIGDNVRLGFGAIVIGGVHIANNVVIAAGAVVVKDIPEDGAIVAGIPATIVGSIYK